MNKEKFISDIKNSEEYEAISYFYGNRCAERSQASLMNHIDEGIEIICNLYQYEKHKLPSIYDHSVSAKAFCLHPLFQNDSELTHNGIHYLQKSKNPYTIMLVMEYRARANEWLSDKIIDDSTYSYSDKTPRRISETFKIIGTPTSGPLPEVQLMLIADKVQNYKDFMVYHSGTHPRSKELSIYFHCWFEALGVSAELYESLIKN